MKTNFQEKTVVVTGAAGFVASHLVDALLESGAVVIGVDNFLTGNKKNIAHLDTHQHFKFIEADVIQPVDTWLPETNRIDAVFHLASPASPPRYQAHPVATYLVNSIATHNLLQFLKQHHSQAKFVFASTSEVYGNPSEHPQVEGYWGNVNPNGVRSCYDEAKRLGETICGVHHRDLGLDVRIMRIFNTYGPRMDPKDGRVIPQFISQALAGKPYTIYGDGKQTRSYCYVSDLVAGILKLGSLPNLAGVTINLGNPGEYSVEQTAKMVHQLINPNSELKFEHHSLPGDDPARRQPNIDLAKEKLGWQPSIDFEQGLAQTVAAFQQSA